MQLSPRRRPRRCMMYLARCLPQIGPEIRAGGNLGAFLCRFLIIVFAIATAQIAPATTSVPLVTAIAVFIGLTIGGHARRGSASSDAFRNMPQVPGSHTAYGTAFLLNVGTSTSGALRCFPCERFAGNFARQSRLILAIEIRGDRRCRGLRRVVFRMMARFPTNRTTSQACGLRRNPFSPPPRTAPLRSRPRDLR